jgi:hypothetical protein
MPPVGFELTISAGERPKTYALDRAVTGSGVIIIKYIIIIIIIVIIIKGIQPLGRSGQRPELSQATGMALVR